MTSIVRNRVLVVAALTVLPALLGGCAAFGEPAVPQEKVEVLAVDAPLREPIWVPEKKTLLALGENEPRLVLMDPEATGSSAVARSRELEDVGKNVAINVRYPDRAYVPQPERGRISVVSTEDLRRLDSLDAAGSPARVTVDAASEILFTLSEDGSTVRGIDLEGSQDVPPVEVGRGGQALLEAPEKGLYPAFWVAGPQGVAHYAGSPPERKAGLPMNVSDIAVDPNISQRAYVAEAGSGRVTAVGGDPEGLMQGELRVVARRTLEQDVEHVASGELFVYAATQDRLVVLRRHDLQIVEAVEYRQPLEDRSQASAPVTGLAVGKKSVYMTLSGEPYILSVDKP